MQFTMNRDSLLHAAKVAAKMADNGAEIAALACVLVEAGDGVSFSATDLDRAITHSDMAMVDEPGSCLVHAGTLVKIAKSLRDGAVTLKTCTYSDGDGAIRPGVAIDGGGCTFELPAIDVGEWPGLPTECDGPSCKVEASRLQDMSKRVVPFVAGRKESREALKGVNVVFDGGMLKMQASDSYRIAECCCDAAGDALQVLVPSEPLADACEAMYGEVEITTDGVRYSFSCEGTKVSGRALAVRFPAIDSFWRDQHKARFDVSSCMLSAVLARASQLGNGNFPVSVESDGDAMRVTVNEKGVGRFEESVPCEAVLAGKYSLPLLKSCMDAMDGDQVTVGYESELKPMTVSGGSVRTMVMPMR